MRWSGGSTVARETFGAVARKHTSTTVRFAPSDSAELERIGPNDIVSTADERDSSDLQQTESVQDDNDLAALSRGQLRHRDGHASVVSFLRSLKRVECRACCARVCVLFA